MARPGNLRRRLEAIRGELVLRGQEHVLRFWDDLSEVGGLSLLKQLESVDFDLMDKLTKGLGAPAKPAPGLSELAPPEVVRLPATPEEEALRKRAAEAGARLLREGRVATLVVAGGQGSRLGFDGPKGAFPLGPVTDRSLFQLHAEKILAARRRHGRPLPWYIMTSPSNDRATREFLKKHRYFGLSPEDVFIFEQGVLPAVTLAGKLSLEAPGKLFVAPDGHGGAFKALLKSGALDDMSGRGIEQIYYFQVDNPLVPVPDPVFVGLHAEAGAEMSLKVLKKRTPEEGLGTVVKRRAAGGIEVIEYTDLPSGLMEAKGPDGNELFPMGSIAIHVISVPFAGKIARTGNLPYHQALKKIPCVNEKGEVARPEEPNGVKFEMFVFDALPDAERAVAMEVRREEEFSPIKNPSGEDSVETARAHLVELYAGWLEACGVQVPRDESGRVVGTVEIGPLTASSAQELARALPAGTVFRDGLVL